MLPSALTLPVVSVASAKMGATDASTTKVSNAIALKSRCRPAAAVRELFSRDADGVDSVRAPEP